MIDTTEQFRVTTSTWQAGFLELLPAIIKQARLALRQLSREAKDEALAEAVAECLLAYRRLWERGELARAYPTSLARYAILRFHAGRRVGNRLNGHDISSQHGQRKAGVVLESPHDWQEILVEDRQAGPAEIAARRPPEPAVPQRCPVRHLRRRR
jgi:hypothetical protein